MKNIFVLFVFLLSCDKGNSHKIDFCEISNLIFLESKKENPNLKEPLIINKIKKINDPTVKNFLLSSSNKFKEYDLKSYFNELNSDTIYCLECQTIDSRDFDNFIKTKAKKSLLKKHESKFLENNIVTFYQPIFNKVNSEFILFYKDYNYNLGEVSRLVICELKNGKIVFKDLLLVSS